MTIKITNLRLVDYEHISIPLVFTFALRSPVAPLSVGIESVENMSLLKQKNVKIVLEKVFNFGSRKDSGTDFLFETRMKFMKNRSPFSINFMNTRRVRLRRHCAKTIVKKLNKKILILHAFNKYCGHVNYYDFHSFD